MIRITRRDGVTFEVTYPFKVTTTGGAEEQRWAKLYSKRYEQDLEDPESEIDGHSAHERILARRIFEAERAEQIDDSEAEDFPLTIEGLGPVVY
jgi:hypothetical protein